MPRKKKQPDITQEGLWQQRLPFDLPEEEPTTPRATAADDEASTLNAEDLTGLSGTQSVEVPEKKGPAPEHLLPDADDVPEEDAEFADALEADVEDEDEEFDAAELEIEDADVDTDEYTDDAEVQPEPETEERMVSELPADKEPDDDLVEPEAADQADAETVPEDAPSVPPAEQEAQADRVSDEAAEAMPTPIKLARAIPARRKVPPKLAQLASTPPPTVDDSELKEIDTSLPPGIEAETEAVDERPQPLKLPPASPAASGAMRRKATNTDEPGAPALSPAPRRQVQLVDTNSAVPSEGSIHIGELLRQAREDRQLDVKDVASTTHIRTDYIRLLESGNLCELPVAPIFTRSYVKSLCRIYGLDVEEVMPLVSNELGENKDSLMARSTELEPDHVYQGNDEDDDESAEARQQRRSRLIWAVTVVCLFGLAVLLWIAISNRMAAESAESTPMQTSVFKPSQEALEKLIVPIVLSDPTQLNIPSQ